MLLFCGNNWLANLFYKIVGFHFTKQPGERIISCVETRELKPGETMKSIYRVEGEREVSGKMESYRSMPLPQEAAIRHAKAFVEARHVIFARVVEYRLSESGKVEFAGLYYRAA